MNEKSSKAVTMDPKIETDDFTTNFTQKVTEEMQFEEEQFHNATTKLQDMKRQYGPQLEYLHQRFKLMCNRAASPEQAKKFNNIVILIEKMMKFLSSQQNQLAHYTKEKMDYNEQVIIKFVTCLQKKNSSLVEQSAQHFQPPSNQSQASQLQRNRNVNHQLLQNVSLTSSPDGSSPVCPMQPGVSKSQPNLLTSLKYSSGMRLAKSNAARPLQDSARSVGQNILGSVWQNNFSCNTIVNGLDSALNLRKMPVQGLKKCTQSQIVEQKEQHMMTQNVLQGNESPENQHRPLLAVTRCQQHAASPQESQHSSPQTDEETALSPFSKAGIPLQSATSPLITSLSNSLTPTSILLKPERCYSGVSPLSLSENSSQSETQVSSTHNELIATGIPPTLASPQFKEFTRLDGNQQSSDEKQPIERLLQVVESLSPKVLTASVCDIGSVISLIDMIALTAAESDSRVAVGEDLVSTTRCCLQARKLVAQYASTGTRVMKRHTSVMALDTLLSSLSRSDSVKQSNHQICDVYSTAMSRIKRQRMEPNSNLLEEIRYINQQLVETVVDLDSSEDAATITEGSEGTIVRCSYAAVAFNDNLKLHGLSSMLPVLPLRLLVPANYPNSSPIVLDNLSVDWSPESAQYKDLSEKTKLRFSSSVCHLSEPVSLGEMAKTWDACTRAVLSEHAKLIGGECFSSRYGTWENCIAASSS